MINDKTHKAALSDYLSAPIFQQKPQGRSGISHRNNFYDSTIHPLCLMQSVKIMADDFAHQDLVNRICRSHFNSLHQIKTLSIFAAASAKTSSLHFSPAPKAFYVF